MNICIGPFQHLESIHNESITLLVFCMSAQFLCTHRASAHTLKNVPRQPIFEVVQCLHLPTMGGILVMCFRQHMNAAPMTFTKITLWSSPRHFWFTKNQLGVAVTCKHADCYTNAVCNPKACYPIPFFSFSSLLHKTPSAPFTLGF